MLRATSNGADLMSSDSLPIENSDETVVPVVYHSFSLPVLALLIPGSIFGVLARLGLNALAMYDQQSIFPLAYAQSTGCLVMGFCLGLKQPIGDIYAPFYTALTTGFCGSLTSFSSWQLDVFYSFINVHNAHRGPLRDVMDAITKTAFTLSVSLASVGFGMKLAPAFSTQLSGLSRPSRSIRYGITGISVLLYAATLPAYFLLPRQFRHEATAAILFSFPGTLTRYVLSIKLNGVFKSVPLGTFTANAFGTALLATFVALSNTIPPQSITTCALLRGLQDGYCGCLTTISTFAVELRGLSGRKAFIYALASWVTGQLLVLVILGPILWTKHISSQTTCTYV